MLKKILPLLLVFVFILSLSVPTFAESDNVNIEIDLDKLLAYNMILEDGEIISFSNYEDYKQYVNEYENSTNSQELNPCFRYVPCPGMGGPCQFRAKVTTYVIYDANGQPKVVSYPVPPAVCIGCGAVENW